MNNEFLPSFPGVGYLSIRTKVPVIPALITGTHESMLNHFLRKTPLTLRFGAPLYPDSEKASMKDAAEFTEKIMEKIKGMV
jgi:1-acyl-sn-glycerol-3-phosphate acyltransferase